MRAWIVLLLPLAGCLDAPDPQPGGFVHDGEQRDYLVHIPDGLDGPAPLLVMLHGGFGDGAQLRDDSGMDLYADAHGFIVAYPDGIDGTWNAAHCCGPAKSQDVDDVGFLRALATDVAVRHPVSSVGVAGHSNGAMMAQRWAAEDARVEVVASVSGAIGGQRDATSPVERIQNPGRAVHAFLLHATDDDRVRYEGGRSGGASPLRIDLPVADAVAFWVAAANATEVRRWSDGADWVQYEGAADVLFGTTSGGHGWPGADIPAWREGITGSPATPDASKEIAAFFAARAT